jgi:hypothetical protein|uniref:Uncharacterized protein n=1 Tax=Desulfomonile tiedjei TaxID=2358 RepID=A0A7C4AR41_9BACT
MEEHDKESLPGVVSAKNIPRPATALPIRGKSGLGQFRVTYLGEAENIPTLSEVAKINSDTRSEARTPLMTVTNAILVTHGGTLSISELVKEIRKYWNRPFPTSPYTEEEFLYLVLRNSPDVRIAD